MIETKRGTVKVEGSMNELMADVSIIIFSLNEHFTEEFGEEMATTLLTDAFEQGMRKREDIQKEAEEKLEKADISTLVEILKEVLKHE